MSPLPAAAVLAVLVTSSLCREAVAAEPSVQIVMLVRNKEPYLPYVLTQLSRLDYPKQRLSLWIASDHNEDRSTQLLLAWLERYEPFYSDVKAVVNLSSPPRRPDESSAVDMSPGRLRAVAAMKQEALQNARQRGIDLVWFLDADVILHDRGILRKLLDMRKTLMAPMLRSEAGYFNFWEGMNEDWSEEKSGRFSKISNHQQLGCFPVALVRSCVLVDLRDSCTEGLAFISESSRSREEEAPVDDAVTLALSARKVGLDVTVCNQEDFGQVPVPLAPTQDLNDEWNNMLNIKLDALMYRQLLTVAPILRLFLPPLPAKSRLGLDRIYVIGLERRPDRWRRLQASFDELGIDMVRVHAVDGRELTDALLEKHNISSPIGDGVRIRLNKGEIGCFLSHYGVWLDMLEQGLDRVLILENDVHLTAEFAPRLARLVDDADRLRPDWDFIYLNRKHPDTKRDEPVEGSDQLIKPGLCLSSLAYVLTSRGAKTLLRDNPLQNMLCVDDYIALMAGNKARSVWVDRFPSAGSLRAFSSRENLVQEAWAPGDPGYVSDTTEMDGVLGAQHCAAHSSRDTGCLEPGSL